MESYAPHARVVERTSSMFRSCTMTLICPWVRVEVDQAGDLEHASIIFFIMKKSDLANETDHFCSIYKHQLNCDFIHLGKEIRAARASKLISPSTNRLITWNPLTRVSLAARNMA